MTTAYDQGHVPSFELRHRLQLARESAGYTRRELADAMDISRNSVLNAESGRTIPRKIVLNAWALACGVPVTWIVTGEHPDGGDNPTSGLRIISNEDAQVIQLTPRISAARDSQQVPEGIAS